jgi:EamA domain-containing membrane protein RarD
MDSKTVLIVVLVVLVAYLILKGRARGFSRDIAKDWLLCIISALLLAAAGVGFFGLAEYKQINGPRMLLAICSVFVFGLLARRFWQFRRRWGFWAEFSVLLLASLAILSQSPSDVVANIAGNFLAIVLVMMAEMFVGHVLLGIFFRPDRRTPEQPQP